MGCAPSSPKTSEAQKDADKNPQKVLRSTILIQNWYRRYRARLEIRRRCTWNVFQSIEYSGEQDQLKLHNFFNTMLSGITEEEDGIPKMVKAFNLNRRTSIYDTKTMVDTDAPDIKADEIFVERSYRGPHLTFPLTQDQLNVMIQAFKKSLQLHAKYTIQLLLEVRKLLKKMPNIRYASTSISQKFTVCGDLHGKLTDLYMIFHKNGLPSVENPYLFNGDFVDRGNFSAEVAIILFSCLLMYPDEVFINRGNHEDHIMNIRYGFVKELSQKYKSHSRQVSRLFEDIFSWLPLATVVDDQIFVCHGGVSNNTDLKHLAKIDRHKFVSILQPPGGCDLETVSKDDLKAWKQVLDLLWSDPRTADGCEHNLFRGGGSYFGPDISKDFLKRNNFKLIIRSHECKIEGYEFTHDNQVLTVFSASSYYETGSNRGAYVQLLGPTLKPHVVQYMSSQNPALRKITFTQRVNVTEQAALQNLKQKIIASRSELMDEFKKYDPKETGKIDSTEWIAAMETVLPIEIPWRTLRNKLTHCDRHGQVIYASTFEEFHVKHRYTENGPSVTETLYRHRHNLETIFRLIDTDHSGCISMEEFEDALLILIKQMNVDIPEKDIKDIARSLDINKDGNIDFNEFLEAFRIVDGMGRDSTHEFTPVKLDNPPAVAFESPVKVESEKREVIPP